MQKEQSRIAVTEDCRFVRQISHFRIGRMVLSCGTLTQGKAHGLLPDPEAAKAIRESGARRRAEYLGGRQLALEAQRELGRSPQPVGRGADGAPRWPAGLTGSISHSGGRCACLLGPDEGCGLGLDIEMLAQGRGLDAILQVALTPTDHRMLARGMQESALGATAVFSAKESLFKALYPQVGRFLGFHTSQLARPPGRRDLVLELTQTLNQDLPAGRRFAIGLLVREGGVLTFARVRTKPFNPARFTMP
jgi:enterobactin synthetase component D